MLSVRGRRRAYRLSQGKSTGGMISTWRALNKKNRRYPPCPPDAVIGPDRFSAGYRTQRYRALCYRRSSGSWLSALAANGYRNQRSIGYRTWGARLSALGWHVLSDAHLPFSLSDIGVCGRLGAVLTRSDSTLPLPHIIGRNAAQWNAGLVIARYYWTITRC